MKWWRLNLNVAKYICISHYGPKCITALRKKLLNFTISFNRSQRISFQYKAKVNHEVTLLMVDLKMKSS